MKLLDNLFRKNSGLHQNVFEVVCPGCKTTYQNGPSVAGRETGCGKCGGRFQMPRLSARALEIDRLVCSFDEMSTADRAHERLAEIGEEAVPRLIYGLKGGGCRRFHSARTLGKIGIDAQVNLVKLSDSARQSALNAVREALTWEQGNGSGQMSQMIRDSLKRAIENLSR